VNGALTGTDDASITLSGPTTLSADVITAGQNITFNNATTLGAAGLTISTGTAAAGNILFNSTLAGAGNGLTATVGSGDITFSDTVTGLGALIAHSAGTTAFNNTVKPPASPPTPEEPPPSTAMSLRPGLKPMAMMYALTVGSP
jgi:hypothetical protein